MVTDFMLKQTHALIAALQIHPSHESTSRAPAYIVLYYANRIGVPLELGVCFYSYMDLILSDRSKNKACDPVFYFL